MRGWVEPELEAEKVRARDLREKKEGERGLTDFVVIPQDLLHTPRL